MSGNKWSLNTRFLHLGLAATVTAQLFISLVMVEPDDNGSMVGKLAYDAHEVVGLAALGIVLLHWLWSAVSKADGGLQHLLPWNKPALESVFVDINNLLRGKLPEAGKKGGLAGLIHGLGLIAVTGAAVTGGVLFVLFPESGEPGVVAEAFAELHEGIATFVWAYWIGHGGIAVLHQLQGHNIMGNIFSFGSKAKSKQHVVNSQLNKHGLNQH